MVVQIARGYLIAYLARTVDKTILWKYYLQLIYMPLNKIKNKKTGEYFSRFSDAAQIRDAISHAILTLVIDSSMVIFCGYILFKQNHILFLISLLVMITYFCIVLFFRSPIEEKSRSIMKENATVQSFLKESIDGIDTVKIYTGENVVENNLKRKTTVLLKSLLKGNILFTYQEALSIITEALGMIVVLWAGFIFVNKNMLTLGELLTFYALLGYFTIPLKNLVELQPSIQSASIAMERLYDIVIVPNEKGYNKKSKMTYGDISFKNVSFGYKNDLLVLKNISFLIKKNTLVGIVGNNGSGKSTIAYMLLHLYDPLYGQIAINGVNINTINRLQIREKIAYIPQNVFLFSDTLRNNLSFPKLNILDDEIMRISKLFGLDSFINQQPKGLNTYIYEGGTNLSAGQRQKIAIVRALLRNPDIIIFDESTSNLDAESELGFRTFLETLKATTTCVIITHKLDDLKYCDNILALDQGKIIKKGSYTEISLDRNVTQITAENPRGNRHP